MVSTSTKLNRNEDLIELLLFDDSSTRMLALHILCEGYATSERVLANVFQGWDQWGAKAFSEFPMLSYVPIHASAIPEVIRRVSQMVQGRKLTEPETRCAGKLVEQLVRLPASMLVEHSEALAELKASSKIFFRVDLDALNERIQLLDRTADQMAAVLDDCVARLAAEANDHAALQRGLAALEALRREHPDYLDLSGVFKSRQSLLEGEPSAVPDPSPSFMLTLASLTQHEKVGLEDTVAVHLLEESESVYASAVEALVRCGTREAAITLMEHLFQAPVENQKWIARGLQRFRSVGLSPQIAKLRNETSDPRLWLMLLIAEVRQFESESAPRLVADLERLQSSSETLLDSLKIYVRLNEGTSAGRQLAVALDGYIQRTRA